MIECSLRDGLGVSCVNSSGFEQKLTHISYQVQVNLVTHICSW